MLQWTEFTSNDWLWLGEREGCVTQLPDCDEVILSCHYSPCCDLKVERMFFIHFDVNFSSLQTADHNPFKMWGAHTVADVFLTCLWLICHSSVILFQLFLVLEGCDGGVSCPRWSLIQSQLFAAAAAVKMWLKRWNTHKDASTLPVWVEQELPITILYYSLNMRLSSVVIPILVHCVNFLQWHFHSGAFVWVSESPLSSPSLPPSVCRQPLDVLQLC